MASRNQKHSPEPDTARFHLRRWRHRAKLAWRWWLWPHAEFRPFFILATYRSGSNLLIDYLRKFPGVDCYGEIWLTTDTIGLYPQECMPAVARRHLRQSLQSLPQPVRGVKLMLDQLEQCGLSVEDLRTMYPHAKFLILYREALVEQFVSHRLASVTGQWRSTKDAAPKDLKVSIDPQQLVSFCQSTQRSYASVLDRSWLQSCSVLMSYEQLAADPGGIFARQICPLLGIPAQEPKTELRKQNTLPLAERVSNYDQIQELLRSPLCQQRHRWPHTRSSSNKAA